MNETHFSPPFPTGRPTRYKCTNCGHIIPIPDDDTLPETCPVCGASKEAFFLVEED